MKTKVFITALCVCLCIVAQAQNHKNEAPKGKAIIQVFGNFHTGFGAENNDRGFELDRSYFGYQYAVTPNLEIKAVMDVGKSSHVDDLQRVAYIKNAQVKWTKGNLTLNGGLISTTSFKIQEDFWGYRYMKMVLQDYYKFASSADLGLSVAYKFAEWISMDAIIVNGEGYKKIQKNDGLQYGLGATFFPVEGVTMRIYGSINERSDKSLENSNLYATFIGYKHEKFSIGAEYNRIENMSNIDNHNLSGVSIYSTIKLCDKVNSFLRHDNIWSKDDWNVNKDEATYMTGIEYSPCRYVKIAPNFRYHHAKSAITRNRSMAYINCYFGF